MIRNKVKNKESFPKYEKRMREYLAKKGIRSRTIRKGPKNKWQKEYCIRCDPEKMDFRCE